MSKWSATSALNISKAITFGGAALGLTFTNDGSGNFLVNTSSTGDFLVQDNGVNAIQVDGNGGAINIGAAGLVTIDAGTAGVSVGTSANAQTVTVGNTTGATAVNINTGTGGINFGDTANTNIIDLGGVTNSGTDTINIATQGTAADVVTIGNSNASTTVAITGGSAWSITAAGVLTVASCTGCGGGGAPDTASFIDTSPAAMADNDTTELFNDATKPNVTTDSTAATVLVSVVVNDASAVSTDDEFDAVRVVREVDGSNPSCSVDPQVGSIMQGGFVTAATHPWSASGTFLDSPATAGVIKYTVCTSAQSVGTVDNTPTSVEVTLVELGADLAENYYTSDDSIGPGDVVVIDPSLPAGVKKASTPYDAKALGVVSTVPGITLDDAIGLGYGRPVPVALAGRIPVKVSTENGRVKTGDLLAPSSLPGVAMKATKAGQVIGQALQDFSYPDGEIGLVVAFVKTDYSLGSTLTDLLPGLIPSEEVPLGKLALAHFMSQKEQLQTSVTLSEIVTDRVSAGLEVISPKIIVDELIAQSIQSVEKDLTVKLGADGTFILTGTDDATSSARPVITFDSLGNAFFAGTITADSLHTREIVGLDFQTQASASAEASSSANMLSFMSFVNDSITFITRVVFRSPAEFLADVVFRGRVVFDTDTAGRAVIPASASTVTVVFDRPFAEPPVVTISLTLKDATDSAFLGEAVRAAVAGVTREQFTIILDTSVPRDLTYSWVALAVNNAKRVVGKGLGEGGSVAGTSTENIPLTPTSVPITPIPVFTPTMTPTPVVTASTSGQTVTVLTNEPGYARIFLAPSEDASESGRIPSGAVATYTQVQDGWYYVVYETLTGWLSGTYVSVNQ